MGVKPNALLGKPTNAETCLCAWPCWGLVLERSLWWCEGFACKTRPECCLAHRGTKDDLKALCLHLYNDGGKQIFPSQTAQFRRIKRSELSRVWASRALPPDAS